MRNLLVALWRSLDASALLVDELRSGLGALFNDRRSRLIREAMIRPTANHGHGATGRLALESQ